MFLSEDDERRTECKKMKFRHFPVKLFRQEVLETLGVHVLRAVAARASPLGDLVREMLRTSFTTVEASGSSVRQRDLLPLPVPWSWAPFAEFLWQAVDERRHRSSHQERHRRHDLHGVGCWSLFGDLCPKFSVRWRRPPS